MAGAWFTIYTLSRQRLLKFKPEQNTCKADGQKIGNRFCHVNSGRLICSENVRHDVDQREQQDKFSGDSDYDRCFCVSNGSKGHLAGHLDAEQQDGSHVDPQCMSSKG